MQAKTRRYKNGDPAVYRDFTDISWSHTSDRDKAMWTEYNEDEHAPISKEVIEFKKKNDLDTKCCDEDNKCKKLEAEIAELKAEIVALKGTPLEPEPPEPLTEDAEKGAIKKRLTELGVPFRSNTGLKKLREKLEIAEDANNKE